MYDEPYRWAEAIANRREYLDEQLRAGSPIVGITCQDGALLLTVGKGQRKIFEVYDRIAFAAIGHPADIEKLRNAAIDVAHVEGFHRSPADVTLQRLVNFSLGPMMKRAFDEIIGSPYIAKVLMAELSFRTETPLFYTVHYDGAFKSTERFAVIAGRDDAEQVMRNHVSRREGKSLQPFHEALCSALEAWSVGWIASRSEELLSGEEAFPDDEIHETLRRETGEGDVEAGLLTGARSGKNKFRSVTEAEIRSALARYL
ncbi:MAG: 20S proteasome subunit A/B [Candidatus Latescibacteria bacterium]|nr:20S proteasome subunit A/B [Candidatus Latescibacterota bacterium]